jgi:hypothetical protein
MNKGEGRVQEEDNKGEGRVHRYICDIYTYVHIENS